MKGRGRFGGGKMATRLSGGENRLVSLPLSRIRVIMKSSPEVSSINQDALFLTAKATVASPAFPPVWAGRALGCASSLSATASSALYACC